MKKLIAALSAFLLCVPASDAQLLRSRVKKIEVTQDYLHEETGVAIPLGINGFTRRKALFSQSEYVVYEFRYKDGRGTGSSVFLYRQNDESDFSGKLDREYRKGILLIAGQFPDGELTTGKLRYGDDRHVRDGLKGEYVTKRRSYHFVIYECGRWMFCILSSVKNLPGDKHLLDAFEESAANLILKALD